MMSPEEIFLIVLHGICTSVTFLTAILVKKFIERKALGMQTILDHVIMDTVQVTMMESLSTWFVILKFTDEAYNDYVAMALVLARHFTVIALMLQLSIVLIIR